jgi:hypothetical protein
MNKSAEPAPRPTDKQLREKLRKMRRFDIWAMETLAALEARLAHQIDDLYKLEQRLGADSTQPLGEMPGSIHRMGADANAASTDSS